VDDLAAADTRMSLPFELGTLRVASPLFLLALLLLPLFALGARASRGALVAALCRAFATVAVVLALAGLYLETAHPESGACIVAAIDRSASVQHAGVETARAFLARLLAALDADDLVGALEFGAATRVRARPSREPSLDALLPAADIPAPEPGDTDLAAALARAAPLCPSSKQTALLLVTDGNETEGSLLAEASLTEPRLPIFPLVPPPAALPAVAIRRLLAPALAPENTVLPLEVVLENRAAVRLSAALRVTASSDPAAAADTDARSARLQFVDLPRGGSVVPLPYRLSGPGQYLVEAEVLASPGDPPPPPPLRAAMTVTRPIRVLVLSERAAPVVATALGERGMRVETIAPGDVDARAPRLESYHALVLDDVGKRALGNRVLARMAAYVARGGALIATGGEHFFGDAALVGTPLERVLPVELQSQTPEPKEREPIALYLVIDRSNSMGFSSGPTERYGEKMEYAKRAALAVLEQLGQSDLVGAVAFDSQPFELAPLAPVREVRAALTAKIQRLQYGGGTDFQESLELAHRSLSRSNRRVRHVILLTDGDTNRRAEDHYGLIDSFARDEITVTTIRIGTDTANLDLLNAISRATSGEFHHVQNVQTLPQLMISDTRRRIDMAAGRRGFPARIGEGGPVLAGIAEDELPAVARWAVTRPKPGAELRLYLETGERQDPLLATWQYELGRAAVLPLDFQAGAAGWAAWGGFAKLWAQLVLWAIPPGLPAEYHLEAAPERAGTLVRLRTVADVPGPFALRLAGHQEVALHQTARRTFAALVPTLPPGRHPGTLASPWGSDEAVDLLVPSGHVSGREQRVAGPNRALLERVAALTGGRVDPTPDELLAARPGIRREAVPLDLLLIPLALVLLLADVAARRTTR
jgi:Mg-chelatase subunit ChlD